MIVFISGPFHSMEPNGIQDNIWEARKASIKLWTWGIPNICPHLNSGDLLNEGIPEFWFQKGYLEILKECGAILMLPRWMKSENSCHELKYAENLGKKIFFSLDDISKTLDISFHS